MGFFGKKKKSSDDAEDSTRSDASAGKKSKKDRKKKSRKDTMASVLNESVVESAVEAFRANKDMAVSYNGETVYVGMLLDTNDPSIGGFNKKSLRDEDKGQIIELINSGRISAYIPADYLDEEKIIIIPDAVTLDAIDEFGLLTEANYKLALVHDDGNIDETDIPITYHDIVGVVSNGIDVNDYLSGLGIKIDDMDDDDADGLDVPVPNYTDVTEPLPTIGADGKPLPNQPVVDDDVDDDIDDDIEDDDEAPFGADEEEPVYDDEPDVPTDDYSQFDDVDEPADEPAAAEPEDAPVDDADTEALVADEPEIPVETMEQTIKRTFYSDELGLELSMDPFDAQFMQGNSYVPFDDHRPDGWLNNYLNEMARLANTEMKQRHDANLFDMRSMYQSLIARHAEEIQHQLDISDPATQYGQISDALDEDRMAKENRIDGVIADRRKTIDDEWEKSLEQVGEEAKAAAQQQYRDRYGKQHDERVFRIEPTVRQEIEDTYQDAVRKMHDERRAEAAKRMDYGVTETLVEVATEYMKRLEDERKLYDKHRERIVDFLDKHRKDDIAHDQILADELAQTDKAKKIMDEYESRMRAKTTEFNTERDALKAEVEQKERRTNERIAAIQSSCDARVKELTEHNRHLQDQVDDLIKQYQVLDEKKTREVGASLAEAKDEAKAWEAKCDNMMRVQRKSSVISITAIVVAIIAALAIGILVGTNWSVDFGSSKASTSVEQSFNDRMDQLEKKQKELDESAKSSTAANKTTSDTTAQQPTQTQSADANANVTGQTSDDAQPTTEQTPVVDGQN